MPSSVLIPLSYNPQARVRVHVEEGQNVKEEQLLSSPYDPKGLSIFSPIPGRVRQILEAQHCGIGLVSSALIDLEGSFKISPEQKKSSRKRLFVSESSELRKLSNLGLPWDNLRSLETVLAEDYPHGNIFHVILPLIKDNNYTHSSISLFNEKGGLLLQALAKLEKLVIAQKESFIVTNDEKIFADLNDVHMNNEIQRYGFQVRFLGHEPLLSHPYILARKIFGSQTPQLLSSHHRKLFFAQATKLYELYFCLVQEQPYIEKFVSLSGSFLQRSLLLRLKLGTSLSELDMDLKENEELKNYTVVINNPFFGEQIPSLSIPVGASIDEVHFLSQDETNPQTQKTSCIYCGFCGKNCPVGLDPLVLYEAALNNDHQRLREFRIDECIECGLCSYSCPSSIPLVDTLVRAKRSLREKSS